MKTDTAIRSPNFEGEIAKTVPAESFPRTNYVIDDSRYDYEGNWLFCHFDSEEIAAARFGFGRGAFDGRDYGGTTPPSRSLLMVHIELMTRDGALLWLGTGRYSASQLVSARDRMNVQLVDGEREIVHIEGWPRMKWRMSSHDGEMSVALDVDLKTATILPDCVMPSNLFSMWLAVGSITCEARVGARTLRAKGVAFFDHPRISLRQHSVPPFGYYLYTPIRIADGSILAGYFSRDGNGQWVKEYSFGLWIDPQGRSRWLSCTQLDGLIFDEDRQPKRWRQRWEAEDIVIEVDSTVRAASISKVWGGPNIPKTRRDNPVFPLVFDSELRIVSGQTECRVRGGGLAEFVIHPSLAQQTIKPNT